jgi:general secretion pathway protein H
MMGRKRKVRGFTLVELMVVIVIVGLAASVVVLTIPEASGSLAGEAETFAARAKAARDGAILEARPAAIRVGPAGYDVLRRLDGEWRAEPAREWTEGTAVALTGGSDGSIRFDATGLAGPAILTLRRGERQIAVQIEADGSVTVRR